MELHNNNVGKDDEKMKKEYVEPEMEIIEFETEDIITTSGGIGLPEDPLSVQAVQPFSLE